MSDCISTRLPKPLLRRDGCQTCCGSTQIRVFACSEFGEGTIAIGMAEVCEQCKRFDDERKSIDIPYSFT